MFIGKRIRELREAAGLSIAKLAARSDISPDYIFRIEHEKVTNIGTKKLENIARALHVHIIDLFPPKEAA